MNAKKASTKATPNFESLVKVVEKKLEQLEGGDLTLEKSLTAYEEGVKALRQCYSMLKGAEGKVEMLTKAIAEPDAEPEVEEYDVESGGTKPAKGKASKNDASSKPDKSLF